MLDDPALIEFINKRNNYGNNEKKYFVQHGGEKAKKLNMYITMSHLFYIK